MTSKKTIYTPADGWRIANGSMVLDLEKIPIHVYDSLIEVLGSFQDTDNLEEYESYIAIENLVEWIDDIKTSDKVPNLPSKELLTSKDEKEEQILFWQDLYKRVEQTEKDSDELYLKNKSKDVILFTHLMKFFKRGIEVFVDGSYFPFGGIIQKTEIVSTDSGRLLIVELNIWHLYEGYPAKGTTKYYVSEYKCPMNFEDLSLHVITEEEKATFTSRAEHVLKFSEPGLYARYEGNIYQDKRNGPLPSRADGRIIIDPVSMARMVPDQWQMVNYYGGVQWKNSYVRMETKSISIEQENLWAVWPALLGFSMKSKTWGRFDAWKINPIIWRDDSFDKLVMSNKKKNLIKTLVEYQVDNSVDIIDDKGGGLIILLVGPPGTGKTLLAETVAETLHRPLYSISIGELGTDVKSLEVSLRNILEVATAWKACILIDEADIFLETRDNKNIQRNAMVSIFLRLLEYHIGNLFLTTNRADNIDAAFESRISIRLDFKPVNSDIQRQIWTNLLELAGQNSEILDNIKLPKMNGRQIKNCIRQAQALAYKDSTHITQYHIAQILKFQSGMKYKKN